MPGSSNNAVITNSGGQVQLNVSDTIGNLTIGSANLLNFVNNTTLTIDRDHHHQLEQHGFRRHHYELRRQQYRSDHWQFGRHAHRRRHAHDEQ